MDSKAQAIYQDLLNRIARGDLSAGTSLPTEAVLTGQYRCSRPTLRKALDGLKQADFITSVRGSGAYIKARPESGEKTGSLFGLIYHNLAPGCFFEVLCGQLAHYASLRGDSIVWSGYVSPRSETIKLDIIQICERYIAQRITGIFFAPFEYHNKGDLINRELARLISSAGIPIVLIDSNIGMYPAANEFDLVSMDHIQAGYILAEHLVERGFRRIFFLSPPNSHPTIKLRHLGSNAALVDHLLRPEPLVELNLNELDAVSGFIAGKKPDAVICSNDLTAMRFLNALEKLGMKVPDDVAVAGFDHLSAVMSFSRPITSIKQPVEAITRTALELMAARIADPHKPPASVVFPGELIVEATTAARKR